MTKNKYKEFWVKTANLMIENNVYSQFFNSKEIIQKEQQEKIEKDILSTQLLRVVFINPYQFKVTQCNLFKN